MRRRCAAAATRTPAAGYRSRRWPFAAGAQTALMKGSREAWFAAGVAVGATAVLGVGYWLRYERRARATITHSTATLHAVDVQGGGAPGGEDEGEGEALMRDEILAEQFTRNVQFFGRDAQARIAGSFVVVVGLGGVGSHAANLLLRSGVSRLRLVDFDQVTLSSLNRHAVAVREDVGTPKALCMVKHFNRVFPEAILEPLVSLYEPDTEDAVLGGSPDFVIDAIDNIDTKVHLLAACVRRGIPVLCSGGAGGKADPTKVRVGDLAESVADPLCRAVRAGLKRHHNITTGVPMLLSTEKQRCDLVWGGEGDDLLAYQVVPNFRVRTIPVLGPIPAVFGMAAAAYVLTELARQPIVSEPIYSLRMNQYQTLYDRLVTRAEERWGANELHADAVDVMYVVKDLFGGTSARALPQPGKGLWRTTHNLELTKWDREGAAELDNLVLLTRDEADAHDFGPSLEALKEAEPEFFSKVDRLLRRARREHGLPGDKSF